VAFGATISNLWGFARRIEDLFALHKKVEESLLVIEERLRALEAACSGSKPTRGRSSPRRAATGLPPAYLPKDEGDDA
jgi:hypothetical protein